jgi:hypothetical protein
LGLKATSSTQAGCSSAWPNGWPVATSQKRADLSVLPVAMIVPSAGNRGRKNCPGLLCHVLESRL